MHYNQAMKLRQKQSPTDAEALQEKVLLLQSQMQAQEIKNQHDANVLQEMVLALQSQVQALEARNQHLLEQFRLAQQQRFGSSSEAHPAQPDFFDEAEAELDKIEVETEEITYTRKKSVRQSLPKDLPREVIIHDLSDEEKSCDCCGNQMHKMGESRSEKLEFIPAVVKVIEHVRPKYGCRHCENHGTEVHIKIAPVPPSIIREVLQHPHC